jgi:sulfite exporter TauE/SafE
MALGVKFAINGIIMHSCHSEILLVATNYPIIISLFLTGLVGSFTHCVGMCGPIVMSQVGTNMAFIPANKMNNWHRISGGALLPYHLGRMTTYAFLGVMASIFMNFLVIPYVKNIASALLIIAAIIFLSSALNLKNDILNKYLNNNLSKLFMNGFIGKICAKLSNSPSGIKGYFLGVLLGFLPCGLIYAAVAAVSGLNPLISAVAMMFFAIGTIPALFIVGCTSNILINKYREKLSIFARFVMVFNATLLVYMSIKLLG